MIDGMESSVPSTSYTVIARKWRPQTFDDVVGQDHVVRTLRNAISSGHIAQAYLFVGPRGTGKTTLARIFAKALNCEKGPTVTPCCQCDLCREIAAGSSFDVLEIDGASNNSVQNIRELCDNIRFAPARGKYRIVYIDEVHMLSASAFNALLKTLEEPPEHVKFVFATTDPEKILPTIISRCQRFDLRRIPTNIIAARLRLIADTEHITVSDDALLAIARGAAGGMRDAQSALDQLIAFTGTTIEEKDVLGVFGLVARSSLEALADALLAGDVPKVLSLVDELDRSGKDLRKLTFELADHFRNLLVLLNAGNRVDLDLTDAQRVTLARQAKMSDSSNILRIVEILIGLDAKLKAALSARTVLEASLVRASRASATVSLEAILKRLSEIRELIPAAHEGPVNSGEAAREPATVPPCTTFQPSPADAAPAAAPQPLAPPPARSQPYTPVPAAPHDDKPPAAEPPAPEISNEEILGYEIVGLVKDMFRATVKDIRPTQAPC